MPRISQKAARARQRAAAESAVKATAAGKPCTACTCHPCQCGKDAAEAKAEQKRLVEPVKLPDVKTHTLTKGACQWDFTPLPSGEVLQQYHAVRHLERKIVSAPDARTLYASLLKQGWQKF